ncbi:uncharacterized protein LAESUDRAFT_812670 [Laetiporus sulphureus 93-53]|uniref:Uncharacterized protein n=1 Tax=Laetiporus sulphureus 93-53 TaxID=1314785 RepID=A0A165ECD2_9APHY|nr:uncharacterized protein LAESUDRAFT_812670 [Laetiporus sulphureus 93-53]KZT06720.1 hypothetical protein LAESUDRAFT_812670 [Laetiporus sulphureus 93-53]
MAYPNGSRLPESTEFRLQTFVGIKRAILVIKPEWDDETLLRELKKTYRKRRGWLSWCCIRTIVKVWAQDDIVYPEHVNQSATSERCFQRMQYYLDHPDGSKGRHEFILALTMDERHGIEYVERYKAAWFYCAAFGVIIVFSLISSVIYTVVKDDVVGGFTIGVYVFWRF